MIPLEDFMKKVRVEFVDLGTEKDVYAIDVPILGLCNSLMPLKSDGSPDYVIYVSNYMLEHPNIFSISDISETALHETLHLYCLDQFGIETEDSFIDYWIECLNKNSNPYNSY